MCLQARSQSDSSRAVGISRITTHTIVQGVQDDCSHPRSREQPPECTMGNKENGMKQQELNKVLELHKKWLMNEDGGVCADLSGANLRGADLSSADLRGADLSGAILISADLRYANLRGADLSGAILSGADLRRAILISADLSCADLRGADLSGAILSGAELKNVKANENTVGFFPLCPDGEFIAWKKLAEQKIAKLKIPAHAKRSSATTLKCRSSEAFVLKILKKENDIWLDVQEGFSKHDNSFVYKVGGTVKVDDYDEDRWNECSRGIHFFISREMAEQYK